jgi:hypothetical protein
MKIMSKFFQWVKSLFSKKETKWPTTEVPAEEWKQTPLKKAEFDKKFSQKRSRLVKTRRPASGNFSSGLSTVRQRQAKEDYRKRRAEQGSKYTPAASPEPARRTDDDGIDVGSILIGAAIGAALSSSNSHAQESDTFKGGGGDFDGGGASGSWDSGSSSSDSDSGSYSSDSSDSSGGTSDWGDA